MRRISRKLVVTFALSVVMLFVIVVSALAGTANSSYYYFTDGSYGYRNQASVITNSSGAIAYTEISANPLENRPAGWMGALARLYNEAGTLVKQNGYIYTSVASASTDVGSGFYTVRGNYYSYGVSKSYNGSGYVGHATYHSPMQTY